MPVSPEPATVPDQPAARPSQLGHDRPIGPFDDPRDRFETREELGRGGMGVVVEAFDRALKRPVAIKHMQSLSDADLARFAREAEITALLEHPGVVPIHDAGRGPDGLPYYIMRRIDGEPLEQVVAKKPFAERIARVPNMLAACDAVGFAHSRGVIHRDLKPANILIGPFGETLVIDWGLARLITDEAVSMTTRNSDAQLTRVGSVAGTPGFMAPEQARGETLDARADVYALGATQFYVLAGRPAISASGGTEMIEHVARGREPEWERLPEETPPELHAIIAKAMAFERDARYRDASELAADLRRYVSGQFVGAYRYGVAEQIAMFVRRHRAAVAVAAIALAVIIVGAVFSVRRILDERDEARRAQRDAAAKRDQLLIQHALHLTETDPAATVTTLRRMPVESREWPRAAAVAAVAATHGIPFGFAIAEGNASNALELSPDSRFAVVLRPSRGVLNVIDLVARTHRKIPISTDAMAALWLDDRTIVVASQTSIAFTDREGSVARTIALPAGYRYAVSDRAGRLYVGVLKDLYRIERSAMSLGSPIAQGVDYVDGLADGRAVLHYGDRVELWTPGAPVSVLSNAGFTLRVRIAGNRVAARTGDEICLWNLETAAPVKDRCHPADGNAIPIAIFGNEIVIDNGRHLVAQSASETRQLTARRYTFYPTPAGFLFQTPLGEVTLWDSHGSFTFKTAARFTWMTQTKDERFVVGVAATGDVLVWDLSTFRPKQYVQRSRRNVFAMTTRAVWLMDDADGVFRLDRTSGEEVQVATATGAFAFVADDEDWLLVAELAPGPQSVRAEMVNTLFNLKTGLQIRGEPGETFLFTKGMTAFIDRHGDITTIAPDGKRERIGAFDGPVATGAIGTGWLIGSTDKSLCRLEVATRRVGCTPIKTPVDTLSIDPNGVGWYLVAGALWQWPVSGQPRPAWPTLSFKQFVWSGNKLLAAGTGALLAVSDPYAQPIAVPQLVSYLPSSERTAFALTPNQSIAAVDVATGIVADLPTGGVGIISTGAASPDGAIAVSRLDAMTGEKELLIYRLTTPREPADLRHWLSTVTNAVAVPDSDAVTWP
jgi:hypothetical protein